MKTILLFSLVFSPLPIPSQIRLSEVIVETNADEELDQTAQRLGVSADWLGGARRALRQATDLVKSIRPVPVREVHSLGRAWVRVHSSQATAAVEELIESTRLAASQASDGLSYRLSGLALSPA